MSRVPHGRPWLRRAAAGALALAALSGCGKSGSSAEGPERAGAEEFGLSLAELSDKVNRTEAAIGQCMSKAGFQYLPLDFDTVLKTMASDQTAPGLTDEQYIAQFGYGITTQFDKPIVVFGAGPQNAKIQSGLPAGDQVAYKRALWGEHPDWNLVRALELEDFSQTGGCTRAAAQQVFLPEQLAGSYKNPSDVQIADDKRMIDALKKWSDCMRKAGFTYENPDSVTADLERQLAALLQGQDPKTLSGAAVQSLKVLQGKELAIAKADDKCFEDHVADIEAKVERELFGAPPK